MKHREVARKLADLGRSELPRKRGGSHCKWFNPVSQQASVVPDWGSRDLKLGTVRAAVRQLGIDWQEFQDVYDTVLSQVVFDSAIPR